MHKALKSRTKKTAKKRHKTNTIKSKSGFEMSKEHFLGQLGANPNVQITAEQQEAMWDAFSNRLKNGELEKKMKPKPHGRNLYSEVSTWSWVGMWLFILVVSYFYQTWRWRWRNRMHSQEQPEEIQPTVLQQDTPMPNKDSTEQSVDRNLKKTK